MKRTKALPAHQVIAEMHDNLKENWRTVSDNVCRRSHLFHNTLSCGHSYCGTCLGRTFETLLEEVTGSVKYRRHIAHKASDCQTVPRTAVARDRLAECLSLHGIDPKTAFRYPCPDCRSKVVVAPAANYMLQSILGALTEAVEGPRSADSPTPETPAPSFVGLFLGKDV
ncbi:hypothetical protein NMY22_g20328 [Coprinellus aureogranulatus]|nr:hypothetical protein NMY22_g20328 [Coprinellus aureogranulatus]